MDTQNDEKGSAPMKDDNITDITTYLERHSDEIGNRILASYPALYGADEAPSPLLSRMVRVPYPAQTLAIMGVSKRWQLARNANVVAECGAGMFAELMPLLRKRRLLLTISLVEGDTVRATVVPQKACDTEDNALTTPLAITGTAEELDRDLPQQLVEFTGAHLQLQSTLASAKAEMDAAAKAAREEARKKTSKPSSVSSPTTQSTPATTTAPPEPEAPSLFALVAQAETTAAQEGGEAS
jgi:PRTRC genetic system protein E